MKVLSIKKLINKDVYDIINVADNNNYIANGIVVHNSAADWAKAENKALKKKLAEVRTKHLLFILCFPLKVNKIESNYLQSFVNYWCDLFGRGRGALFIKDKNPVKDAWNLKAFEKLGSYNEFTEISAIEKKLSKHPNFWRIITFPKPPKWLYERYLRVRERNVYDDDNILQSVGREDIHRALLVLALRDIMVTDETKSMKRIILHLRDKYDINVPIAAIQAILKDSKDLVQKVREQSIDGV